MRLVRLHEFGPPENLRYEESPDIEPGPGQVRIAVTRAGVHLVDTTIRAGAAAGPFADQPLPTIPGREVAGVVDRIGPDVDDGWLGERVVAHLGMAGGGYADQAVVAVEALHRLPETVDDGTAVTMIGTGRTTAAIVELAEFTRDDVVLVTGAAGGLGTLLIQEATAVGATAVGLAGGDKLDTVRSLGAFAVDSRSDEWSHDLVTKLGGRKPTVLLDGVGGGLGRSGFEILDAGGRLVLFGWASGEPFPLSIEDIYRQGVTVSAAIGPRMMNRPGGLRPLESGALEAASSGRWKAITTTFPLEEAAAAHRAIEARATIGKTLLAIT